MSAFILQRPRKIAAEWALTSGKLRPKLHCRSGSNIVSSHHMSLAENMAETARERWRVTNRIADVLEAEVKARRNPLIARAVSWFNLCRLCQDVEEQMLLNPPAADE